MRVARNLVGLTTREVLRNLLEDSPEISGIQARIYFYISNEPSTHDKRLMLKREDFLQNKIVDELVSSLKDKENITLGSLIEFSDGGKGHVPMLDLAPVKSPETLEKVIKRLKEILAPEFGGGVILESKKSYQFIGLRVFKENLFNQFLGRALITSIVTKMPEDMPNKHEPIVDYRYVGHSLIKGATGLRITARGDKDFMPKVICTLE